MSDFMQGHSLQVISVRHSSHSPRLIGIIVESPIGRWKCVSTDPTSAVKWVPISMITLTKTYCQIRVLIVLGLTEREVCVTCPCCESARNCVPGLSWGALIKSIGEMVLRRRPFWVSGEKR
ncbi:hypothetical protein ACFXTI_045076 [Malus domestica]